ncbi:MAG: rRNA pseudouridine synthase [Nitrospiraceae bacterium]|nr:rRNA pseudouridine synthase [Nitrospiraceae bacterium]
MQERIQKIIANFGKASRRKAEEMILEGRVTVNGATAELGMKADMFKDHIKLDGKLLVHAEEKIYLAMNKPKGVVTTLSDPEGRPTVKDYLKGVRQRVYPVGRLDYDSEGLLILTNDGELANSVMHPSGDMPKTYSVKVKGIIEDASIAKIRKGMTLDDGPTLPAKCRRISDTGSHSWIEITLFEGRKRQIRRMLDRLGHPVIKLKRISIDGVKLGSLKPGMIRDLSQQELDSLMNTACAVENNLRRKNVSR